ncbi:MAG: ankyrin repeat domain-containing protein, partial [Pseudomonadota bacterium]
MVVTPSSSPITQPWGTASTPFETLVSTLRKEPNPNVKCKNFVEYIENNVFHERQESCRNSLKLLENLNSIDIEYFFDSKDELQIKLAEIKGAINEFLFNKQTEKKLKEIIFSIESMGEDGFVQASHFLADEYILSNQLDPALTYFEGNPGSLQTFMQCKDRIQFLPRGNSVQCLISIEKNDFFLGHLACRYAMNNEVQKLEILLRHGASPNFVSRTGSNPIFFAALNGCVEALKLLAEYGANFALSLEKFRGSNPLHLAIEKGQPAVAEYLIAQQAELWAENAAGHTPASLAVFSGEWQLLHLILTFSLDTEIEKPKKLLCLLLALVQGDFPSLKVLQAHDPSLFEPESFKEMLALKPRKFEFDQILQRLSNELGTPKGEETAVSMINRIFVSALSIAPYSELTRTLARKEADGGRADSLMIRMNKIKENSDAMLKAIIKFFGVNDTFKDFLNKNKEKPAVLDEVKRDNLYVIKDLDSYFSENKTTEQIKVFNEINTLFLDPECDRLFVNALLVAASAVECPKVIEFLIGHGANVQLIDEQGHTAASLAAAFGQTENLKMLGQLGFNLDEELARLMRDAYDSLLTTSEAFLVDKDTAYSSVSSSVYPNILRTFVAAGVDIVKIQNDVDVQIAEAERARLQTQTEADLA